MSKHAVVSKDEWIAARKQLLLKEKELTKMREKLSQQIREMPWVKVEKEYLFDTPTGKVSLSELFDGRSQLIVKHFMMAPGQTEGCVGCSFEVDQIEGALKHLQHHDVTYVAVARAPIDAIEAFKKRMGWGFRWVSSFGSDFNYDFYASFKPEDAESGKAFYNYEFAKVPLEDLSGRSVFYKDENGDIYLTYSSFARGMEELLGAYVILDVTPNGRNEKGPNHNLTDWVRHHDRYGAVGHVADTGRWVSGKESPCCNGNGESHRSN